MLHPNDLQFLLPTTPDSQRSVDLMDSVLVDLAPGTTPVYQWSAVSTKALYGAPGTARFGAVNLPERDIPFRRAVGARARDLDYIPDPLAPANLPGFGTGSPRPFAQVPATGASGDLSVNHGHLLRGGAHYHVSYRVGFLRNASPTDTLYHASLALVSCPRDVACVVAVPLVTQPFSDANPFTPEQLFSRVPRTTSDLGALRGDVLYSFSVPMGGARGTSGQFHGGLTSLEHPADALLAADANRDLLGDGLVGPLVEAGAYGPLDGVAFGHTGTALAPAPLHLAPGQYVPFLMLLLTPDSCETSLDNLYALAAFGQATP